MDVVGSLRRRRGLKWKLDEAPRPNHGRHLTPCASGMRSRTAPGLCRLAAGLAHARGFPTDAGAGRRAGDQDWIRWTGCAGIRETVLLVAGSDDDVAPPSAVQAS